MKTSVPSHTHSDTAIFRALLACFGVTPGQFTPPLGPQTLSSTQVQGDCCVCLRPVLLYQARDAGFLRVDCETVLVHWECAEAVRIAKAEPVETQPAKSVEQIERERSYRADLWAFHIRTLYAIINEYGAAEESNPEAITDDMRWQINIVHEVYEARADDSSLFEGRPRA